MLVLMAPMPAGAVFTSTFTPVVEASADGGFLVYDTIA